MGIEAELQQVSLETLELLLNNKELTKHFFIAKYLPESPYYRFFPELRDYDFRNQKKAESIFSN